jgi:hypothetical protein
MAKRAPKSAAAKPDAERKSKATPRKAPAATVRPAGAPVKSAAGGVYQLKITLDYIRPTVWRRVLVKDCSLADLHDLIQISFGWDDYHLHIFEIGHKRYGDLEQWEGDMGDDEVQDERKVKLSRIVSRGVKKFHYEYDMGDSWGHTIQVEKTLPAEVGVRYPRCVDGARACPPEDCGGPWSYADFLDALQDPQHPRHEDQREWMGGDFDPEAFDLEALNAELAR